jgi:hypothetical protein
MIRRTFLRAVWGPAAVATIVTTAAFGRAEGRVGEAPPSEVSPRPRVFTDDLFARAGAGIGRAELFLGREASRPSSRLAFDLTLGLRTKPPFAAVGTITVDTGDSDHGVKMRRVTAGGGVEFQSGVFFADLGPHALWFGARRVTGAGDLLWRLGIGIHAMVGVRLPILSPLGVFVGVRGDADVLVGASFHNYGSVAALAGVAFR